MQIIPAYYASPDQLQKSSSLSDLPIGLVLLSFLLTSVLGYLIYSNRVTPYNVSGEYPS
jgi:hypothetical protein